MTAVVEVAGLTKRYGSTVAVNDASFSVGQDSITGLLGRNGAGKTTLMALMTGQAFASSGAVTVFGESPVENPRVLGRVCFIKESQTYPDALRGVHALKVARTVFPHWDDEVAAALVAELHVPLKTRIKKMSRGQRSALGVIIGIASRAELTIFDEPYAGLDAVARHIFYDRLLEDYARFPRTVIMSTHLIDDAADLLDHVVVIDGGRIIIDAEADALRGSATTVAGKHGAVQAFASGRNVLTWDSLGGLASVTIEGLDEAGRRDALAAGLELAPVSLQQLIIGRTRGTDPSEVAS